ncbi:mesoderm posterior protein 2 [Crocuta crocuta]
MAQSPPLHSLLGQDHWTFPQGWGWAGHPDSTSPASSSSDSSGSCPCPGARPPACPEALAAPERLGSRVPDMGPWVTPPYHPGTQSPPQLSQGRALDAALWTPPQASSGAQTSPEPRNQAAPWTPPPAAPELAVIYQGLSVSPESCLLPRTPPLLSRPACQRLQPQPQWACWSPGVEMPPGSEAQGPGPDFRFGDESPSQSSGVQLSDCPELWQEDLEGAHLGVFY